MAQKIEIGLELDTQDWIDLNEYLNSEKVPTQATIEAVRLAQMFRKRK